MQNMLRHTPELNGEVLMFVLVCMVHPWIWLLGYKKVYFKLLQLSNSAALVGYR